MNIINLYTTGGESSLTIIFGDKKKYENKKDFLTKVNENEDLINAPIDNIDNLKEIKKEEFEKLRFMAMDKK